MLIDMAPSFSKLVTFSILGLIVNFLHLLLLTSSAGCRLTDKSLPSLLKISQSDIKLLIYYITGTHRALHILTMLTAWRSIQHVRQRH